MEAAEFRNPLAVMNPADQQEVARAKAAGMPFLAYRNADHRVETHALARSPIYLGRSDECDICLGWDRAVSKTNLEVTKAGSDWRAQIVATKNKAATLRPENRTNGTKSEFSILVLARPYRLRTNDLILVGYTTLSYWEPPSTLGETDLRDPPVSPIEVSDAERRVLFALAGPLLEAADDDTDVSTMSNQGIADKLGIGKGRVENIVTELVKRFDLEHLPRGRKREALARRAIVRGIVS